MKITDFKNIEFGICIKGDDGEPEFYLVPVDKAVKQSLVEMLNMFYDSFNSIEGSSEKFQTSEKYGTSEKLTLSLDHELISSLKEFYQKKIEVQAVSLSKEAGSILYYYAIFRTGKTKKIAVKRPSAFKGLLKKHLVHLVNDTLKLIKDDVFKLDHDFDFVISKDEVEILHPNAFIYVANVDEEVQKTAVAVANLLGHKMKFIDFKPIADFVGRSKTAAKLVSSIRSRTDLQQTSKDKLVSECQKLGVKVTVIGNQVVPDDDSILDFLHVLDRREYSVDVTMEAPEIYRASSRKKLK